MISAEGHCENLSRQKSVYGLGRTGVGRARWIRQGSTVTFSLITAFFVAVQNLSENFFH